MKAFLFPLCALTLALACSGDGYYQHSNPTPGSSGKGGSAGTSGACVQGARIQCSATDPRCTQLCSNTGTWSSCICGDITDPAFGGSSGF